MKALVKKYNAVNELTFVEIGDEVMMYTDVGYERLGTVIAVITNAKKPFASIINIKFEDDTPEVLAVAAQRVHSENEMTEAQFESALLMTGFCRRTSKLPMHVRTKLADGSDAHFLPIAYVDETDVECDSYSAILRELLVAREWENQRV